MDRKRTKSLPVFRLVFSDQELERQIRDVLSCPGRSELEALCQGWSNTQRLQVVSKLLLQQELESALSLLCLFPCHGRRMAELKLQALIDLKRYEEAETQASLMLTEDPDCSVTREKRMMCRRKLGRKIEELTDKLFLLEKIGADPQRLHNTYLIRGSKFLRAKRFDEAAADIRAAEQHLPQSADSLALRGKLAYEFGDYHEAVGYLTCSLEYSDSARRFSLTSVLTERSLSQQKMGRYQVAMADLDRAMTLEVSSELKAWLLWMRASLHQRMGEKDMALKDLTWGLVLDPGNVHLQILHAKLTGKGYEPEEPGENENPWQSQFSIALSLFTQGAYDDALREIHKLEEALGPSLQTRFWKAQIYLSKGEFQKGRELRDSIAGEALAGGKVMLWAWARDLDWRCRLDDLWNDS